MKKVLAFIEEKKAEFEKLSFFTFLQDTSIDPLQRMAWVPCMAPFAMCFKDINAYALRKEPADSPLQEAINHHTYEDATHWAWYLADLEKLGFNVSMPFADTLRFLWGAETQKSRQLAYDLIAICNLQNDPALKLIAIECMEATGQAALMGMLPLCRELEAKTGKRYHYFGETHLAVELGHIQSGFEESTTTDFLEEIVLTEAQEILAFQIVEKIFESFCEFINEQMDYAQRHRFKQPFSKMRVEARETLEVA